MANTVKISSCELINADCLEFIRSLPENSVDLIVTDPPYFKVKPEGWDNQWKGDDDYLKWLDQCLAQFWRVLKPAGSLYLFCGHRLASDIEIMMRERFSVLNHIIWAKPSGRWNGCNKESLRAYFPPQSAFCSRNIIRGRIVRKMPGIRRRAVRLCRTGLTYCQKLLPYIPNNAGILLVPCCRGGSAFTQGTEGTFSESTGASQDSARWGVGKPLYQDLLFRTKAALQKNPKNVLLAICWMQGNSI